jgi:integrase
VQVKGYSKAFREYFGKRLLKSITYDDIRTYRARRLKSKTHQRILTNEESQKLVNACIGKQAHLRPIVIAGLDTGCRMREILKLRWRDVELQEGSLTIQAFNTKTMRERKVAITTRLAIELRKLWESSEKQTDAIVFGGGKDVRQAFRRACEDVRLEEIEKERITFHHLRHFHAAQLDDLGFSLTKIGAQLVHVVWQTTLGTHRTVTGNR